ncbi:MAG: hypothetical protein HWN70_05230 [Desulfobacterales bacterium]|nr:hypothetical protein [Desulfobacterales bacterium]
MEGSFSDKLVRIAKAAFFGLLGGTAIIHITPLVRPIIRDFESRYLSEKHHEFETATLLIVGFLVMVMEPVVYIVNLGVSLERHGSLGFLWIAPVAISQSYAFIRWIIRRHSCPTGQ